MKNKDKESAVKKAKDQLQVAERSHKEAGRKADAAEATTKQAKSALKKAKQEFKAASKVSRAARQAADDARAAYAKASKRALKADAKLDKARKKAASPPKPKPSVKDASEPRVEVKVAAPRKAAPRKKTKAAKSRAKETPRTSSEQAPAAEDSFVLDESGMEIQ
jgi:hypothetical protein